MMEETNKNVSLAPHNYLEIFSLLSNKELGQIELLCKLFRKIAQEVWETRAKAIPGKPPEITDKNWARIGSTWLKSLALFPEKKRMWLAKNYIPGPNSSIAIRSKEGKVSCRISLNWLASDEEDPSLLLHILLEQKDNWDMIRPAHFSHHKSPWEWFHSNTSLTVYPVKNFQDMMIGKVLLGHIPENLEDLPLTSDEYILTRTKTSDLKLKMALQGDPFIFRMDYPAKILQDPPPSSPPPWLIRRFLKIFS